MAAGRVLMMLLARIVWQTYSWAARENVRSAAADNSTQPPSPEGLELQYVTGAVSGLTTPGSVTSESSYDPANDTDLDCIDLLSGKEIKVASPTLANVWVMMEASNWLRRSLSASRLDFYSMLL
ncbi:hypothetical protein NDA13_006308 [Ustilago tritici]|nr:hypothetical protein NDA13_006308 [Ustilago tritici]